MQKYSVTFAVSYVSTCQNV